jgi:hypothetical protein
MLDTNHMSSDRKEKDALLLEASTALLADAGGSLPITSLNKSLFYLDLAALRDLGRLVTGAPYLALPAGPVVAKYDRRIIAALEDAGIAQQDESEDGHTKPVCLIKVPELKLLSPEQRDLAKRIADRTVKLTPGALSDLSHKNVGWQIAWEAGLGAKRPAQLINMKIAMQQLLDVDPWIDELPDGDCGISFLEADEAQSVPW